MGPALGVVAKPADGRDSAGTGHVKALYRRARGRAAASVHLIYSATAGSGGDMRELLCECAPRAITKMYRKREIRAGD